MTDSTINKVVTTKTAYWVLVIVVLLIGFVAGSLAAHADPLSVPTYEADSAMVACIERVALHPGTDVIVCNAQYHAYCSAHAQWSPDDCYRNASILASETVRMLYGSQR